MRSPLRRRWFNNHQGHQSHGLGIGRDAAREQGIVIDDLEDDEDLQDLVLSAFHATPITFNQSPAVQLIENHLGRRLMKSIQMQQIQIPFGVPPAGAALIPSIPR